MAASGNATSAFDLSTATPNGFFDTADLADLMAAVGGGGDAGGLLICDNNNNELSKHSNPATPTSTSSSSNDDADQGQLLLNLTSLSASVKDRTVGDQSIDSGVAGGDSDEADCCNAPSLLNGGDDGGDGVDLKDYPSLLMNSVDMLLETAAPYTNGLLHDDDDDIEGSLRHGGDDEDSDGNEDMVGGALEESSHRGKTYDQDCKICQNKLQSPRVLSCLHVFCELCLDRLLLNDLVGDGKFSSALSCPVCDQQTAVGPKGASSLHMDYVLTNILDLSSIDLEVLACTSCKGKEVAISRCNDCANILCASCDNAHQYMRCFENHKVVKLQDLLQAPEKVAIHKPLFCAVHPTENLKYYCQPCQVPVCNECLIIDHKGAEHSYEVIGDAEQVVRAELERMAKESQRQVEHCNEVTLTLDTALTELQSQHDTARALIEESYQSFKAVLERCRDEALKELDGLHSERELKIMEVMHEVEKSTEKIESAHKFTGRVLESCNGPELLSLKRLIGIQFSHLVNHIPKTDVNYSIEFESKFENFKRMAQETFGAFRTEVSAPSPKESTPPPTLPGLPPILINHHSHHHQHHNHHGKYQPQQRDQGGMAGGDNNRSMMNGNNNNGSSLMGISAFNGTTGTLGSQGTLTNSVTASSPISLPPSMQSSFDGDMSALSTQAPSSASTTGSMPSFGLMESLGGGGQGNGAGPVVSPMQPPPMGPPPNCLTSIAEYNIQQLVNLVEQTSGPTGQDMTDSIIPTNTSVPPPNTQGQITLADILSGDPHALQAWSKMGSLNQQAGAMLSRGPSPSVDNLLLNDFSAIAPNSDDLILTNFNGGASGQAAPIVGVSSRTKSTAMQIRCKFGSLGPSKGQFNSPHGFCLGVDEEIIVADTNNHRIEVFEKTGTFKFQFGVPGKDEGQLWYPRKVAVMRPSSKFVVCDRGNERSRMQIFNKAGHFMKKIAIRYIDIVAGLAVTNQGHIVAVDSVSPTVFIISEEGDLVHWFDCSDYMREPSDIAINGNDFYVCDFKGHCVAVFSDDGTFKYRIGNEKITCFPNGIDISDAGDILIGDSHGNRFHVACFSRDGVLQSEYECPYVKVSRCCGLKITSEGFVVTLAKNNHHVLVLNTLYIQ